MDATEKRILFAYLKKIDKYDRMKHCLYQHIYALKTNSPHIFKTLRMNDILTANGADGLLIYVIGAKYLDDYHEFKKRFSLFNII